jgi:hypothetical protein
MQIDRSNYEIWFTDWLDDNLNSLQVEQLKQFLDQNPDLSEELNDLNSLHKVSSSASFPHKEKLKKSLSEISEDQFEYLCAAYLENDLSENQKAELQEIINLYTEKKRTFDLIQKTILPLSSIRYNHKKRLLKRTPLQKVIRISAIALSTAAAVSIFIFIYSVIPGAATLKQINNAQNLRSDNTVQPLSQGFAKEKIIPETVPVHNEKKTDKMIPSFRSGKNAVTIYDTITTRQNNSEAKKIGNPDVTINKVPLHTRIELKKEISGNKLIAASQPIYIPNAEDERSPVGKFISKTFREKILKEKMPKDTPLDGFEIAEAGITGLNKLFGWQMALEKKTDENGQPKSVYFSSEILKFNAPVKKKDSQQ